MNDSGFLHRYFLAHGGKVIHKWLHYFDIYEDHLDRFRGRAPVMLEIGVSKGGSLGMWKAYLGPGARIVGLDINPDCKRHEAEGIEVFIGSQDDPGVIERILAAYPEIDIVLDDGSHRMDHLRRTFELLYHRVKPDGLYMLEDLHSCYWPNYGGGVRVAESFMEYVKDRIDDLNASHTQGALPITPFTAATQSICIYDSIVVFERRPQGMRRSLATHALEPGPSLPRPVRAQPEHPRPDRPQPGRPQPGRREKPPRVG